ncbi:MAG: hypothetical protein OXC30_00575 [Alphaproteobacteria bacterium]|nr:hypothetical protein [Alphaproteobacteria bacterium]
MNITYFLLLFALVPTAQSAVKTIPLCVLPADSPLNLPDFANFAKNRIMSRDQLVKDWGDYADKEKSKEIASMIIQTKFFAAMPAKHPERLFLAQIATYGVIQVGDSSEDVQESQGFFESCPPNCWSPSAQKSFLYVQASMLYKAQQHSKLYDQIPNVLPVNHNIAPDLLSKATRIVHDYAKEWMHIWQYNSCTEDGFAWYAKAQKQDEMQKPNPHEGFMPFAHAYLFHIMMTRGNNTLDGMIKAAEEYFPGTVQISRLRGQPTPLDILTGFNTSEGSFYQKYEVSGFDYWFCPQVLGGGFQMGGLGAYITGQSHDSSSFASTIINSAVRRTQKELFEICQKGDEVDLRAGTILAYKGTEMFVYKVENVSDKLHVYVAGCHFRVDPREDKPFSHYAQYSLEGPGCTMLELPGDLSTVDLPGFRIIAIPETPFK